MKLTHIKAPATAPSAKLEDWGPVGEPVGQPVPALRGQGAHEGPDVGVWECSPGKFRRQIKSAEFCHFIAGHCIFHADSGEHLDIRTGDAVFFPANTLGTWEILETARKTYIILDN